MVSLNQKLYNNINLHLLKTKFYKKIVSYIMRQGKKNKAESLISQSLILIQLLCPKFPAIFVLKKAISNILPFFEYRQKILKARRKVKLETLIPVYNKNRRLFLAVNFILKNIKLKKNQNFFEKFPKEIILIFHKKGDIYKKYKNLLKSMEKKYPQNTFRW